MIFGMNKNRKEALLKMHRDGATILRCDHSKPYISDKYGNHYILVYPEHKIRSENLDRRTVEWLQDRELVKNIDKNPYKEHLALNEKGIKVAEELTEKK